MKKNKIALPTLMFLALTTIQCGRKPDFEAEKQKLLQLHTEQQAAHLEENAEQFVRQFEDGMISVNSGKIAATRKDDALKRFQKYFDTVTFKKWEDVAPPQIVFSDDASMAYMVVDKLVVLTYENEQKQTIEETTHFAWVSIFKKQPNGAWKITCNVSTNEPSTE
jgi:hypothetical protein